MTDSTPEAPPKVFTPRIIPFALADGVTAVSNHKDFAEKLPDELFTLLPYEMSESAQKDNPSLTPAQMETLCERVNKAVEEDPTLTSAEAAIVALRYLTEVWPGEKKNLTEHASAHLKQHGSGHEMRCFSAVVLAGKQPPPMLPPELEDAVQEITDKASAAYNRPPITVHGKTFYALTDAIKLFSKALWHEKPDAQAEELIGFCEDVLLHLNVPLLEDSLFEITPHFTENALQRAAYEGMRAMQREGAIGYASAEQIGAYFAAGALVETACDAKGAPLDAETKQKIHESILEEAEPLLDTHFEAFKTNYYATAKHAAKKQDVPTTASTFTRVTTTVMGATIGAWAMSLIFGKAEKSEDGQTVYRSSFLKRALGVGLIVAASIFTAKIAVQGRQPLEAAKDITSFVSRTARNITAPVAGRS